MKEQLGRAWRSWVEIGGYFGDFQSRLILTIFYATVFLPFAVITRVLADPLHARQAPESSGWITRQEHDVDLQASRRQF